MHFKKMKNTHNTIEDFLMDDRFAKWALQPDEKLDQIWENYISAHPDKKGIIQQAKAFLLKLNSQQSSAFDKEINEDKLEKIWLNIQQSKQTIHNRSLLYVLRRVAAILSLLIGISAVLYFVFDGSFTKEKISGTQIPLSANPDKIQLILSDSSVLALNDNFKEEIISLAEVSATMLDGKTLEYKKKEADSKEVRYNTLIVPRGRKLNLILSDETKVWLNSNTRIRYPTIFDGNTRDIQLIKGEAYFEVTENKQKPFIVTTKDVSVRVLGTSFNITAYEEDRIETVLVEGSVHMYSNNQPYTEKTATHLLPKQKASYTQSGDHIILENVDPYLYTSWKDGVLIFRNESFLSLSKKIERWYDVNISFSGEELKELHFTGVIREGKTIEHILNLVRSTNPINYEINGKDVLINLKMDTTLN